MLEMIHELWLFVLMRRNFWLVPVLLVMVLFGGLLVVAEGSAVAPFVYTLF
jgi:hypothetical protein